MKIFLLSLSFLLFAGTSFAQLDSLEQLALDSAINSKNDQTSQLIRKMDSLRLVDSLNKVALEVKLSEASNLNKEEVLRIQAQVDSISALREERKIAMQLQIDSVRASAEGADLIIFNDTLFQIYCKIGPFSPTDRATSISNKVELLYKESLWDTSLLKVSCSAESCDIMHGEMILFSVTSKDAIWAESTTEELANEYLGQIKVSVQKHIASSGIWQGLKRIGLLILVLALLFVIIKYLNKAFTWINKKLVEKGRKYLKGVRLKNYELLSAEREELFVRWLLKAIKWFIISFFVYLSLPTIFSIFPATKGVASSLFGYVTTPLKKFGLALAAYLPELITIIVIIIITRYVVKFLKFLAKEIEDEKLKLPGFYPEWVKPTFGLLKIVLYAFSFIIIFPYLPGSGSPVFQGVSVFLGVLISLGSSSAIGNIIAGLVITYMRAFKIGDRVKIGETTGDVLEKTMLVTRLKTIKNEYVTIPNSSILSGSTINYNASSEGLVLHTTITIGYDVPWRDVHELLINAALKTELVDPDPKPFVYQTSLDDFYVSYQINAITTSPKSASKIYSELHANIQDAFNEAGVEILSPHYRAGRDGNMVTIPASYLSKDYKAPSFNVKIKKDD